MLGYAEPLTSWSVKPAPSDDRAAKVHVTSGVKPDLRPAENRPLEPHFRDLVVTCPSGGPRSIANIMLTLGLCLFGPSRAVLQNVTECYIFRM